VLGIGDIDTNFNTAPVPTMRFNNDEAAYMLVWNYPLTDRWIAVKEVWYDVHTKLPRLVVLFDDNGRIVLRAYLKDHVEVEGSGGGKIAGTFELFFPENKSQMNFRLKDVRPNLKVRNTTIPNDASFAFPDEPGVGKIIEIK